MVIILDTSVLALATGSDHPSREPCRRILAAHRAGRVDATTTVEVLQEFLHIRARRRPRSDAARLTMSYFAAFDLLTTLPADLRRAVDLFERHPGLGAFDAVLAAVTIERRADALISADRAFGAVDGLRWVDPASPELDALLAG